MRKTHVIAFLPVALALGSSWTGCRDREVSVYQAPKDPVAAAPATPAAASSAALPAGHPPIPATGSGAPAATPAPGADMAASDAQPRVSEGQALQWKAPAHWQVKPAGAVRKGSYKVVGPGGAEADMAITAFPGDTGGRVANVNRWRGQVGLPPQSEAQIDAALEHLDVGPLHIDLVELVGTSGGATVRMLGAMVPHEGQTWFFKMAGPDAVVAAEREAFKAFLKTVTAR